MSGVSLSRIRLSTFRSYAYCAQVARRAKSNFTFAFQLLPPEQRRSMYALYAFLRCTDDLGDGPEGSGPEGFQGLSVEEKRYALSRWRSELQAALVGDVRHPLFPALVDTLERFTIPPAYLEAVLDGVAMDLEQSSYPTFTDLYRYCYQVASVVGLSCLCIWEKYPGSRWTNAEAVPAEAAGVAFQLTNILRDVGEDAARGRVYLPLEDLERFRYRPEELAQGVRDDRFRALMTFQVERARAYYRAAEPLVQRLPLPGRAVYLLMQGTYRTLLEQIVRSDFDVFRARVRVGKWRKLCLALRVLPVRYGLLNS